jgi:glycosyltransferase involved in cell wall biosynthesis
MANVLIVATSSYAGMGPYVSEIVNSFLPHDNVFYFFHDFKDHFFKKNIKKELHNKSMFVVQHNSAFNKLRYLLVGKYGYEQDILFFCKTNEIKIVHFVNGTVERRIYHQLKMMGIKVIETIHDLRPHESKKAFYKMIRQEIISRRIQKSMLRVHYLVTNSSYQFDELEKIIPDGKVFYHDFPTLVTDNIVEGKDIPPELLDNKRPYILFFGRIEQYKGLELLLKAYVDSILCEKYGLVIAGKGELPLEKHNPNILLINRYIKDTEIRYLYEHAICVVYPYISATQSGVLSLSFYFGTPTLASDIPFFKSIIGNNENGYLFRSGDLQDLKEKLIKLLESDTICLSRNAKEYYASHYQKDKLRLQLLGIYNNIIKD